MTGAFDRADWAWAQTTTTTTAKLVLLALAKHANAAHVCWPSLARLAKLTGCQVRTVTRSLDDLEAAGLIERTRSRGGAGRSSRYLLCITEQGHHATVQQGHDATVSNPPTGTTARFNRDDNAPKQGPGDTRSIDEPLKESSVPSGSETAQPTQPCIHCGTPTAFEGAVCHRCLVKPAGRALIKTMDDDIDTETRRIA